MRNWCRIFSAVATAMTLHLSAGEDPLQKVNAYSLYISPEIRPEPGHFPVGILGDHGFTILPFMGLTLTERSHCCYEFLRGKPCSYPAIRISRGLYFFNIWAAHSIFNSKKSRTHGTIKTAVSDSGKPYPRHQVNLFDENSRDYVLAAAASSTKAVAERDGRHILFWGIDNEWELPLDYSPEARAAFPLWLEKNYSGDLKKFNRAWRRNCKSFQEAEPPKIDDYSREPGAWLDWRRFQEETYADFLHDYFKAIQESDPQKRPVISKSTQCTIEMQATVRNRTLNHELLASRTRDLSRGWYGIDQYGHDDRSAYELNYLYHCILPDDPAEESKYRHGLFLAEANNHAGPGWQFAQTFWRLPANGLKGINFFVLGYFGAANDYATFGMTAPDGTRRSRFYYLTRFANLIHRSERFWHDAFPLPGLPKLAILMPQRDVLLAGNTGVSLWDFSTNNRLNVFRHLRDAGFWVDILPYGKLTPQQLSRYQALFLINAEHLSARECAGIAEYVKNGGLLFADMLAGLYDEHHIESRGLESVLGIAHKGVYKGIEVSPDDLWFNTPTGRVIRGDGKILADLKTAELVNKNDIAESAKTPMITRNRFGKGAARWYSTRLGALRSESAGAHVVSEWFASQLKSEGILPAFQISGRKRKDFLRVEQPLIDQKGNCAIVVAGLTGEKVPAQHLTISLPGSNHFRYAFWGAAENSILEKINFSQKDGTASFALPELKSAGVIYLFPEHPPVLGIKLESRSALLIDGATPELVPGERFRALVQIVNPTDREIRSGNLRVKCLGDWTVFPQAVAVGTLKPGEIKMIPFAITVPETSGYFIPNFVYPVLATLETEGKRIALCNAVTAVKLDPTKHEYLLSDNQINMKFPRPFVLRTGAEYRYNMPSEQFRDPANAKQKGQSGSALTRGHTWYRNQVRFTTDRAEVIFDLKKRYAITKLGFYAPKNNPVRSVNVQIGEDEKSFRNAKTGAIEDQKNGWIMLPVDGSSGQYVKIYLEFKNTTPCLLDEIEVYGRPLK